MKASKELIFKATTNTVDSTATLAKNSRGIRPMKSMVGVRSFRPKNITQAAASVPKTELTTQIR